MSVEGKDEGRTGSEYCATLLDLKNERKEMTRTMLGQRKTEVLICLMSLCETITTDSQCNSIETTEV